MAVPERCRCGKKEEQGHRNLAPPYARLQKFTSLEAHMPRSILVFGFPILFVLAVSSFPMCAQTLSSDRTTIPGLAEPPELIGLPQPTEEPSKEWKELLETFSIKAVPDQVEALGNIIQKYPEFGAAHSLRVMLTRCEGNPSGSSGVTGDIDAAIRYQETGEKGFYPTNQLHSIKAKVEFDSGDHRAAMEDLYKAMTLDISSAIDVFNSGTVEAENKSDPCRWNKPDVDALVREFPTDYRSVLYRGLYYAFLKRLEKKYTAQAITDLTKATVLNPKTALPYYFMAQVYTSGLEYAFGADPDTNLNRTKALAAYNKAIQLDPKLIDAYYNRASLYYEQKQNRQAIADYDKVIESDPKHGGAYNDRALAKFNNKDYYGAIRDFSSAIENRSRLAAVQSAYENRGDAFVQAGDYDRATKDFTEVLKLHLSNSVYLMNIAQFRRIYPEYAVVSDEVLSRKLHAVFFSGMKYQDFAEHFATNNSDHGDFISANIFIKRGDAYLKGSDYRRAVADYQRALRAYPDSAQYTDRWHSVFNTSASEMYLDSQTVEYPTADIAQFWIKLVDTKQPANGTYELEHYAVNCRTKMVNTLAYLKYNSSGNVTSSVDSPSGYKSVVPDTLGEQLYSGMCH
jgi:tetratricopeptide (TPR) repeat protein